MDNVVTVPTTERGNVYAVLMRQARGDTLEDACTAIGTFTRRTLATWRKAYPTWIGEIESEVTTDLAAQRKEEEMRLSAVVIDAELVIQAAIVEKADAIVKRQVDIAANALADKDAIAAARAVRDYASHGFLFEKDSGPPRTVEVDEHLPYDPHSDDLSQATIMLPPGSKVSVEVPDLPIEPMPQ